MSNRLANESSPYLLQHADNPVDWFPWGGEAFDAARAADKPVLLSVGYSSCHWCHVMAHECFENPDIAQVMNELFVNVKVDREERPDVDAIYMQALQSMTGGGGWPMTVFLLPDGAPFYAGTYFPPEDRGRMPGFTTVLRSIADAYASRRPEVEESARELQQALITPAVHSHGEPISEDLESATTNVLAPVDDVNGGFGAAPKFPQPLALEFLIQRGLATGNSSCMRAVDSALRGMARGGIYDQLAGGFHRYSVDAQWDIPHFEKMLYDNAQLARVYLHAYQVTGDPEWLAVVEKTLEYLIREMQLDGGGFAASQDADTSEGEGVYFAWTPAQVGEVVGEDDAALACEALGVSSAGNFEHGLSILTRRAAVEDNRRLADICERMLASRMVRPTPSRDDKLITSWNALAITAFAEAGSALHRADFTDAATRAAQFIASTLVDADGRVLRSWRLGKASGRGFLEDAALLSGALLSLYEATGEHHWFRVAVTIAERAVIDFKDPELGFCDTANDGDALIARPRTIDDNPLPSGQSSFALTALRLYGLTTDTRWRDVAVGILSPLRPAVARSPLAVCGAAIAMECLLGMRREIAIIGTRDDARTAALATAVLSTYDPCRVLAWGDGTVGIQSERSMIDDAPTAYVCEEFACQRPVNTVAALESQLRARICAT